MPVIVYCYVIHFMIFLYSVLNTSYMSQTPLSACSHIGSAKGGTGERLECGRKREARVFLPSFRLWVASSTPWFSLLCGFQLFLAAPSQMVLVLAWQPPSRHFLLVLHVKFPPRNYLAGWSHGEATRRETSPSCYKSSLRTCQTGECRSPLEWPTFFFFFF